MQDRHTKAAMTTTFRLSEFVVIPIWLGNAAQTFQMFMHKAIQSLENKYIYLDDVLLRNRTEQQQSSPTPSFSLSWQIWRNNHRIKKWAARTQCHVFDTFSRPQAELQCRKRLILLGTNLNVVCIDNCGSLPTWLTSVVDSSVIARKTLSHLTDLLRNVTHQFTFPEAAQHRPLPVRMLSPK